MGNSWDKARTLADQHASQGGIFVRLADDGDKVVGAFCDEPFAREVVWTGERYETYDAAVHTAQRPSLRVMLNFYVPAESAMKIIEGGTVWFKDVLKIRDKYGVDKWLFEIERHGESRSPKTTYSLLPEEKIDDGMRAKIAACELHDLAGLASGLGAEPATPEPTRGSGVGEPATPEHHELAVRLRRLPRDAAMRLLARMGCKKVSDLPARQIKAAHGLITQAELEAESDDEIPF